MSSITNKGGRVPDSKRIVFLGDSITDNGTFIAHMDYYFTKYMSDKTKIVSQVRIICSCINTLHLDL